MLISYPCNIDYVIVIQSLLHLFKASGSYASTLVLPTEYQFGRPISILPDPPGAIVVYGLNATVKVF